MTYSRQLEFLVLPKSWVLKTKCLWLCQDSPLSFFAHHFEQKKLEFNIIKMFRLLWCLAKTAFKDDILVKEVEFLLPILQTCPIWKPDLATRNKSNAHAHTCPVSFGILGMFFNRFSDRVCHCSKLRQGHQGFNGGELKVMPLVLESLIFISQHGCYVYSKVSHSQQADINFPRPVIILKDWIKIAMTWCAHVAYKNLSRETI